MIIVILYMLKIMNDKIIYIVANEARVYVEKVSFNNNGGKLKLMDNKD